jgi:hypothetical protein
MSPRYPGYAEHLNVRWRNPDGRWVAQTEVEEHESRYVGSVLELPASETRDEGRWTVEVRYRDEVLEQRTFDIRRPGGGKDQAGLR